MRQNSSLFAERERESHNFGKMWIEISTKAVISKAVRMKDVPVQSEHWQFGLHRCVGCKNASPTAQRLRVTKNLSSTCCGTCCGWVKFVDPNPLAVQMLTPCQRSSLSSAIQSHVSFNRAAHTTRTLNMHVYRLECTCVSAHESKQIFIYLWVSIYLPFNLSIYLSVSGYV